MAKRVQKNQPKEELAAQIRVDVSPDTPSYYVNFIGVSHTAYDFTLSAARIPSPLSADHMELARIGQPIPVEAMIQIVIPPLLVEGLILALTDQKAQHDQTLAKQVKNNDAQHKHVKPLGSVH